MFSLHVWVSESPCPSCYFLFSFAYEHYFVHPPRNPEGRRPQSTPWRLSPCALPPVTWRGRSCWQPIKVSHDWHLSITGSLSSWIKYHCIWLNLPGRRASTYLRRYVFCAYFSATAPTSQTIIVCVSIHLGGSIYCFFFKNPFLYLCAQSCQCCGVCWLPAVMRWCLVMRRCAWRTAWSCRGLPAACWALILCCFCCATRQPTPRAQACRGTRPSLWGSCVAPNPGDLFLLPVRCWLPPHSQPREVRTELEGESFWCCFAPFIVEDQTWAFFLLLFFF